MNCNKPTSQDFWWMATNAFAAENPSRIQPNLPAYTACEEVFSKLLNTALDTATKKLIGDPSNNEFTDADGKESKEEP